MQTPNFDGYRVRRRDHMQRFSTLEVAVVAFVSVFDLFFFSFGARALFSIVVFFVLSLCFGVVSTDLHVDEVNICKSHSMQNLIHIRHMENA